ncbi:unnamed protein product [Clonostachys solani]|uniref:Zn(2)-C6 fungal-type domain-containing protein n=1 Tax=Clonostachys solani TaxID=160281 RepID=A0A9P0EFW9_9HYPO|nr:unnamed protein product [Clonostachys solani]
MSLQMESTPSGSPPSPGVAPRDCPECKKSRRKCDRTIPTCRKCISRGVECPGYDPFQLKWIQGLTRENGKFSGQSIPEHWKSKPAQSNASPSNTTPSATPSIPAEPPPPESEQIDKSLVSIHNPVSQEQQVVQTALPHPSPEFHLVREYSSSVLFENLLGHFSSNVVPRLTWIDLSEHPWRSIILSLAQDCLSLRLSIGCLAAAHLSTTSLAASTQQVHLLQMRNWFRDACLRILNSMMRQELQTDQPAVSQNQYRQNSKIVQVLATMLVLCYSGAVVPGSTDWALHLGACRTVIDTYQLRNSDQTPTHPIERFLLKEVADLETLSSISVFNRRPLLDADESLQPKHSNSFWSFTDLINEITTVERTRHAQQSPPPPDMPYWHSRAEQAYQTVLTNITQITNQHQQTSQYRLESALRSHYYANIIYSYQAFETPRDALAEETVNHLLNLLFNDLESTLSGPVHEYTHTIFFPLLIAGTECRGDGQRQALIGKLFMDSLTKTGMWFNHTALKFLHSFWERANHDKTKSWIHYARENEGEIGTFIAY